MNKIGIVIDNVSKSDINLHLFFSLHTLHSKRHEVSVDILYQNMAPHFMPIPYSVLHFTEAWSYGGNLLATSMQSALNMNKVVFNGKKFFYIWELEWIERPNLSYQEIENVYQNDSIQLITRTDNYANIIEKVFGKKIPVVPNFDMTELIKIVG